MLVGRILSALAVASLGMSGMAMAIAPMPGGMTIEICSANGPRTITLPGERKPASPGDCGTACHAICARKRGDNRLLGEE